MQKWINATPATKMHILRELFTEEYTPLEIPQLAMLSTYMVLEGYTIPQTTNAMLAVLYCLEQAGAVEVCEDDTNTLMVRIK